MLTSGSRKPKIMVVDDQEIVRYTLDVVLDNQGYQVFQASSVMEAISVLAQNRPDLVLLDLTMPDIEGIVLLRQMRKSPLFKSTPVIILTAHSDRNFVAEALALGARDYVLKLGFLVEDLLARIRVRLEEAGVLVPARTKAPTPLESNKPLRSHMDLGEFLASLEGKVLPASKAGILQSCVSSLSSLDSTEALLKNDPIIAALMISKARSLLVKKRPLGRIGEALQILGETHQLEVLEKAVAYASDGAVPEDLLRAYAHAIFCSRWLERFCPEMNGATLVGLFHDLPEILLMQQMNEEGWGTLREVARGRGKVLTHMIEELFGIPYGEFAGAVFQKLGLPEEIVRPIMDHANAFLSSSPVPASREALRLEAANQWAHAYLLVSTRNVPLRLPVKGEVEPMLRPDERAEIALLCDQSWAIASRAFQGMDLLPESYRLALPANRPRFVLLQESWVSPQSALEHFLCEYGQLIPEPIEDLAPDAWDVCIYLGDQPLKAFPNGFGSKPMVVLHRLSRDSCQFPQCSKLETLRMPASISQMERLLSGLA